jgi:hypothetical protein
MRAQRVEIRVQGKGARADHDLRVQDLDFKVQDLGFRMEEFYWGLGG